MKLTVKTLKGEKFPIEVELNQTVAAAKTIIEAAKAEMAGSSMKLIHSGKVLKDDDTLEKYGIKENDFLVVMLTKPKKTATTKPATPAAAAAAAAAASPPAAATAAAESKAPEPPKPAESTTAAPAAPAAPSAPAAGDDLPAEIVSNLVGMGFPEDMVRHCLRVARGNPDVAMEFLTNGIPAGVTDPQAAQPASSAAPSSSSSGGAAAAGGRRPLQALRDHPQLNELRRLVQSNPQMLQQVLAVIGQQQPELLQEINGNQALFLEIMNEPIESASGGSTSSPSAPTNPSSSSSAPGAGAGAMGMPGDPAQMAQMMQNMDPAQLQMMANMMGLSPEQVQAIGRMIGQLPPEQLQEYMAQAMQGGVPGGGGGGMGGQQVLQLTQEEMAAVDRLTELGFDRAEAAQAFIACDKNEALAANFLMDSAAQDPSFFGGGGSGSGSGGDGGNNNSGDDNADDMYD